MELDNMINNILNGNEMIKHDGCVGCKYEFEEEDNIHCMNCKQNSIDKYIVKTNFDKIKSMDLDEFSEWITSKTDDAQKMSKLNQNMTCNYKWKEWLNERAN